MAPTSKKAAGCRKFHCVVSVISHFAPKTVESYSTASVIFQILQLLLKLTPFLAH
jgi:hypothetical protein